MKELKSTVHELVELTDSELDMVAGGQAAAFVKQSNKARVSIGNHDTVTNTGGAVAVGTDNMVMIDQSNSNSGSASATLTTS